MNRSSSSLRRRLGAVCALITATLAGAGVVRAQPADTCMPRADGVPFRNGPPNWRHASVAADRDQNWDDPRWRGAMGLSHSIGTANPPVQTRAIWGRETGECDSTHAGTETCRYVYLQWIIRTAVFDQPHYLLIGLRHDGADTAPAGTDRAIMIQAQLAGSTADGFVDPTSCNDSVDPTCSDGSADKYSVFLDSGNTGTPPASDCTLTGMLATFSQQSTGYTWIDDSLHYQRMCSGASCDLWAVSLRVPIVPATDGFDKGIHENDGFWYELRLPTSLGPPPCTVTNPCMLVDSWPRTPAPTTGPVVDPLCRKAGDPPEWYHATLSSSVGWSKLYEDDGGSRPSTCFGGLRLQSDDIGVLVNPGPGPTSTTAGLDWLFKAYAAGAPAVNRVVARPRNETGTAMTGRLSARFRLAQWGAEGLGINSAWTDITGSTDRTKNCMEDPAAGTRTCATTDQTIAASGGRAVVSYEWTLGEDPTMKSSELCAYGITPSGGSCADCPIPPATSCGGGTSVPCGTQGTVGAAVGSCVRKLANHQCFLVELDSTSDLNFENASVYRNMNVAAMSETMQIAWITSKGLPVNPQQTVEEMYLVVMPRNVPGSVPTGTTGLDLIHQEAARERDRVLRPYQEAVQRLSDNERAAAAERIRALRAIDDADPVVYEPPGQDFPGADLPDAPLELMPKGVKAAVEILDGAARYDGRLGRADGYGGVSYGAAAATDVLLDTFDDVAATAILPTLDLYVFRHVPGSHGLSLMSSFTLVVHHEGPLTGIEWQIDGAEKKGRNLWKLEMPVGHKKQVRIRVMADEGTVQAPGNKSWPCAGGCCGRAGYCSEPDLALGNGVPFALAAAVWTGVGLRRRKRQSKTTVLPA